MRTLRFEPIQASLARNGVSEMQTFNQKTAGARNFCASQPECIIESSDKTSIYHCNLSKSIRKDQHRCLTELERVTR